MEELKRKPPYQMFYQEFDDNSCRGVFAVRWKKEDFSDINEFREFSSKYSSAMQALIQFESMEEAEDWYSPEPHWDTSAVESFKHPEGVNGDAAIWAKSVLDFSPIPWLHDFEHETLYIYEGDVFPELVAEGSAGYLNVFVADSL